MKNLYSYDESASQFDSHECDSFCGCYCEVCDLDYCGNEGHECLLDEFEDIDEEEGS